MQITITAQPSADKVAFRLGEWADRVGDWRPAWRDVRAVYNRHQRRHWATEGASTGSRWPDNAEPEVPIVPGRGGGPYDAWKRRLTGKLETLVFTGRLRAAATGGAGSLDRQTRTTAELGVSERTVPYAQDHHEGRRVRSALFNREVQLKTRPVIRFNGSPLGTRAAMRDGGPGTFGYAIRQLMQAHVIKARRRAFGLSTAPADATIARILVSDTR